MNDLAIVVPSCDKYCDVWPVLFKSIARNFPTACKLYLVSNYMHVEFQDVINLKVGPDVSWSDNLIKALKEVSESYVLIYIDDLILDEEVNADLFFRQFMFLKSSGGNYIRLNPTPPGVALNREIASVRPGSLYRSSTVFSIWKKSVLESCLMSGESAWDFEIFGSTRTDNYDGWYASRLNTFSYVNLIIKGKVDGRALKKLNKIGIPWSTSRTHLSRTQLVFQVVKEIRSWVFSLLPAHAHRRVRNLFRVS